MKKENNLYIGVSEPKNVDEFMSVLEHPLIDVVKHLRSFILSIDTAIGEGIYWNAPTFYYTGEVKPLEAKEYKRYLVGFVFNKRDCIRMVFLRGAEAKDSHKLLEGDYADGRRLAVFNTLSDAKSKEPALREIVESLLKVISK